jgi:hypothetical protein
MPLTHFREITQVNNGQGDSMVNEVSIKLKHKGEIGLGPDF